MAKAAVILPAAGRGTRLGTAKQWLDLGGVPMIVRSVLQASACEEVGAIVVVVPAGDEARAEGLLRDHGAAEKLHAVVAGGDERADSVRAGLRALSPEVKLAAVHDAARPFASPALFTRVIAAAREAGAALAALPATDTVKRASDDGQTVAETLDRSRLWLAQTPQAFAVDLLASAYEKLGENASRATDEASLLEAAGHRVVLVPGEKENFKVTDADDLARARQRLELPAAVGFGFDVHAYAPDRPCILGGLEFPGEPGLLGHSDADAALHAIADAILGGAGLGDIGQHFPDTDERFAGADSGMLLREVVRRTAEAGFAPLNVDLTIAAARPKIGPRRDEMRQRIASLLGIDASRVNVKATTTEGLGFIGRREGLAAQAVVLLRRA